MKRFVVMLLVALVALPSVGVPAAKSAACSMARPAATPACSACAADRAPISAMPAFKAGCCRFLPHPESVPAQAGSLGATPKPVQSPDVAAVLSLSDVAAVSSPFFSRAHSRTGASPPHAPPTRTTHLLL